VFCLALLLMSAPLLDQLRHWGERLESAAENPPGGRVAQ
jgi:hypothetical protein